MDIFRESENVLEYRAKRDVRDLKDFSPIIRKCEDGFEILEICKVNFSEAWQSG